jgi:lipopolysaccharide/colanic/teichoic acid biosynthesis glycosyltransferase
MSESPAADRILPGKSRWLRQCSSVHCSIALSLGGVLIKLGVKRSLRSSIKSSLKRSIDILCALILLLLGLPALLLAMIVIRLSSPGPVLFRQQRMGREFEPFEILKLRTMAHAEAGLAYTLGPDPRITPFGKWLRRTKLDELPQLWNVLRGDMSLVGPRPVLPELASEFYMHYRLLLRDRPGLTDPASIKYSQEARLLAGARDPMLYFKSVVTPDKIQISLDYMDRANLWTDAATMAMTALVCCVPSLSRLYGRVPSLSSAIVTSQDWPSPFLSDPALATTSSVYATQYAPELIHANASPENASHNGAIANQRDHPGDLPRARIREKQPLPWKTGHIPSSEPESTPREAAGRALRL